jgi:hypothetical protein
MSRVSGDRAKVGSSYEQALLIAIERTPRQCHQAQSSWTCRALAAYLAAKGHPRVSAETIRRHLHRLRYRVIRPVLSVASPDPQYAKKRRRVERAKRRARRGECILLFEDEVDLHLLPGITGCWTRRGTQRKVETPRQNRKRYGFGAVNFMTGEVTRRIEDRKTGDGFASLIEQIVARYCGKRWHPGQKKVALVIDNFGIHSCKRASQVIAHYRDRLEVIALPTYAPELNVTSAGLEASTSSRDA